MKRQHQRWRHRWLVGILILTTGCASTPAPPAPPAAVPPTSATAGDTTIVAIAPPAKPCCPHPTLLDFLGITQIAKGLAGVTGRLAGRLRARLGMRFPGLESKPPLVEISDPANLSEDASPAQQAAANAKAEEDAALQKAKALRYLATLGCGGCYPDVEQALLAALEDCTELVRFEAVSALRDTTFCPCVYCNADGCCSAKVQKALRRIAYEIDENGCYDEPSARVRRVARIALVRCNCVPLPLDEEAEEGEEPLPAEGPTAEIMTSAEPPPAESHVQLASFEPAVAAAAEVDPGKLLATVNGQPIFMHHVAPRVSERWQATAEAERTAETWQQIVGQETERAIDDLLLYQLRAVDRVWDMVGVVDSASPLPDMAGFPAARQQNRQWLQAQLPIDRRVEQLEIQQRYHEQREQHKQAPAGRWEQISVPFGNGFTREQAHELATYLRNKLHGALIDPPAHFSPERVTSQTFPWRRQAQVEGPLVAQAVFGLPIGRVSPLIEEDGAWHLVRILERRSGQVKTLAESAESIRESIIADRIGEAESDYFAAVRPQAIIWRP